MVVSIIVPIYNAEKYLDRCVESILSQTYSDIEVILVNDGSQDSSLEICEKYALLDDRVIVVDQKNKGAGSARNTGIKIATGDYIGFIDADDAINSDMVLDFVDIAKRDQPDVICSNFLAYEPGNLKYNHIRNDIPYNKVLKKDEIKRFFLQPYFGGYMGIIPSVWTKIYKTDFLRENNILFDEFEVRSQDYWFNFIVFKMAITSFSVDKAYYHYYYCYGSQIRSYRSGVFEMFVTNRQRLIFENKNLKFKINWPVLNQRFIDETNEYIMTCIKSKGLFSSYKLIKDILEHKEFQDAYMSINPNRLHTKLIKKMLSIKSYIIVHFLYFVWSFRLK